MQKLPEASNRKRGDTCEKKKKKKPFRQKERTPFSFSSNRRNDNTSIFLAAGGRPHASIVSGTLANLSLVAVVSVNILPRI